MGESREQDRPSSIAIPCQWEMPSIRASEDDMSRTRTNVPYIPTLIALALIAVLALIDATHPMQASAAPIAATSALGTTTQSRVVPGIRPALKPKPKPVRRVAPMFAPGKPHTPVFIATAWGRVPANTYFGKWYDRSAITTRNCIVRRESDGQRTAFDPSGASGLYQFMLPWTHTIQQWTGEHTAIHLMSYQAQDLAFWRAWDFGKGASNWSGGRWSCPRV